MADDDAPDEGVDSLVEQAADELYAAAPEDFLAVRRRLAAAARGAGEPAAAKAITALRKPTTSASLVNRLALADDDVVARIVELGDRLRAAHEALDAAVLRDLTQERRALVGELTRQAVDGGASGPVQDEVTATFDAAIADPSVAARLGRLTRSEQWSGFGVAPAGPPTLTVVRGGRGAQRERARAGSRSGPTGTAAPGAAARREQPERPEPPAVPAAERRKLERARQRAQDAFDSAEAELTAADGAERAAGDQVRALTAELARVQQELDAAKRAQEEARRAARSARTRRREARSALDRAERNASRGR